MSQTNLLHLDAQLQKQSPFLEWQEVTVTFPASADTDLQISHTLKPLSPEDVDYRLLQADRACAIYHDVTGTRAPWTRGIIRLRCNVASAVVRLLLTVPNNPAPRSTVLS